ncbi:MAG: LLM class F420-dependent oxidoreductase [Armatimonadota bacterium]
MKLGVVFPQTEIGNDAAAIRDFAQAVEALGYAHLAAYDHVLGADPTVPRGQAREWLGSYTLADPFHEVFVLFGYLAGSTRRIELGTGVLILPQRQTALVAKQAAELDVLSGGRVRLGVGLGWNSVEYEALGMDFRTRGARMSEQVKVLRALWTQESVTFSGRWHHIVAAGINPMPIQRPIPIWMGGSADAALRRTARLADGWFFGGGQPDPYTRSAPVNRQELVERLRGYARAAGRDPAALGLEGRVAIGGGGPEEWRKSVEEWKALGATHLGVSTMRAGLATPAAHIDAIRRFRDAVFSG